MVRLSWAYIESVLVSGASIYKLCPKQGAHLTWVISWSLGEAGALRTQTEGWGRCGWDRRATLGRLPGGRSWASQLRTEASGKLGPQETTAESPSSNLDS